MITASTTVKITKPAIAASLDTIINHPATKDPAAKFNTSAIRRSISERANGTKPMKLYRVSRGWFFIDEIVRSINIPAIIVASTWSKSLSPIDVASFFPF